MTQRQRTAARTAVLGAIFAIALAGAGAAPARANDAYVGIGLGLSPGQPKYKQSNDLPLQFAFELLPADWRFSLTQATFDSDHSPTTHINSQVIGAEKIFVHKFDDRFSLNGGLGVGFYQVSLTGAASGTGSAFGLMATGGGRVQINSQLFAEVQFQYRNAAIPMNGNTVVDAGWTGFGVNLGFIF